MSNIHPTAVVSGGAKISESARIGAYAYIEDGVEIGPDCQIFPHAHILRGAVLESGVKIHGFCTISGLPQDIHFDESTPSYARICSGSVIREGSTIHRATVENASTLIGRNCFFMANSHVGHDCVVGDRVIIAPFSALGGFVEVGPDCFISGGVMLHQRIRVGEGVMVSGASAMSDDVPPFVNAIWRNSFKGLNLVGLNRRGVPRQAIANLKETFSYVCRNGDCLNYVKRAVLARENGIAKCPEAERFLDFFIAGRRYVKPYEIAISKP